ncbi:lysine-rich nucleolar protein 1-like [Scyliorhinus canicula]|uniref:lysine-rich nucleolar protein 1-like n=1 Tax=Scyliorhinus canicula TaxID=7830 RepID=UPI0018F7B4FE|nr:lysine-rich nucleolar protein 1-like [Scyliorhinus canicula]
MFKNDIETTQSKSVKSKKQIEINIIVNQNKEYEKKNKFERGKKKTRKTETKNIQIEANDIDVGSDLKRSKKKKSKSKKSSTRDEEDPKIEKQMTKKSRRESKIDEDKCDGSKRKRKKNLKSDDHSDPQNISVQCPRNSCEDDPNKAPDKSKHKKKKKKKNKDADMEEGLTKNIKISNGTADKLGKTIKLSCVAEAKSVKKRKKKKRSHSVDTSEDEKPRKKRKRDRNIDEPDAGNDKFKVTDSRKQKDDEQTLDTVSNTDKAHKKKRKKEKVRTEQPVEKKVKGVEQMGSGTECITKSSKKRKRFIEAAGEENKTLDRERLTSDKSNNVCKLQNSPETPKGKKQRAPFNAEKSGDTEKKIKRKKKDSSSGMHVCKVKEEFSDNGDLLIMSEKKGNLFEVTIDKARRQALQEEIDRVSGKTGTLETKVSPEIKPRCTGTQWDSATFGSLEQKNKFLRLMGGFKSSNPPPSSTSGKPNMALNKEEEQKFNRTLQQEFDKALNLRQHQGIGLGFQPFSNLNSKIFFIDKHASKSKKFDFN